jgi:hypothetical protein
MKTILLVAVILYACVRPLYASVPTTGWHTIHVEDEITLIDDNGDERTFSPSCAFDVLANETTGLPEDNSFKFYVKPGRSNNMLIYFNGGGACWNHATCVDSLALNAIPDQRSTYNPSINETNSPIDAGGIFDDSNRKNPFRHWTKVFIPYCTGDLHIGSNDMIYRDLLGTIPGSNGYVKIQHRGFDNFMAVREWLKVHYGAKKHAPKKLLVAGSSAGGYGASINFPYLQAAFPSAQTSLISDAAAGILSAGFVDSAFTFDQAWLVENTLAPLFSQFLGHYSADSLNADMMGALASSYPNSRFAQYSTAMDAVQVLFYKMSDQIDQGNLNPSTWGLTTADYLYFLEWNGRMVTSYEELAAGLANYQYYIADGTEHTVLTDEFATETSLHPFYTQQSADGIKFRKWLYRFAMERRFHAHNVSAID